MKNPNWLKLTVAVYLVLTSALFTALGIHLFGGQYNLAPEHPSYTNLILAGLAIFVDLTVLVVLLYLYLKANAERRLLCLALDASQDMFYIKDNGGHYVKANLAFCTAMGITPEDLPYKRDTDLLPDDLLAFIQEQDNAVITGMKTLRYENWLNTRDRQEEYFLRETLKSPIISPDGSVLGIVSIGRDITDQHRVKIALHKRERLLAALTKATQHILQSESSFDEAISPALGMIGRECQADAVLIYEEDECSADNGAKHHLQYAWWRGIDKTVELKKLVMGEPLKPLMQELQKKNAITISDINDLPPVQTAAFNSLGFKSVILAAISFQGEFWGVLLVATFDLPRKWSLAENAAIEIAAGQFAVILQRQQTEASLYRTFDALRQSQSRLGIALQAANAVPFEFDLMDGAVNIDPSFFLSLGYEKEWYPQSLSDTLFLIHPDEQRLVRREIEALAGGEKESMSVTVRFRHKSGDYAWFNLMGTPRFESDQPTSIIGLAQDITEKRRAENELLQSERMAAVGTLAAGVAHNFNNLNTGILGHLEMLQKKERLSEKGAQKLELVINTVKRSITLTDSLLAFSGKRQGKRKLQPVAPLLTDTAALVHNEFTAEGIGITLNLDHEAEANCSAGEICHVIFNLLVNARHAMLERPAKQLTLSCGKVDSTTSFIKVSDTGCGIPENSLKNLFMPFFTTKGEHAKPGSALASVRGTGLGLSSSKSIVDNHGGTISVESAVDKGTTFTIHLPATAPEFPGT